jgi:hypothetical protein
VVASHHPPDENEALDLSFVSEWNNTLVRYVVSEVEEGGS